MIATSPRPAETRVSLHAEIDLGTTGDQRIEVRQSSPKPDVRVRGVTLNVDRRQQFPNERDPGCGLRVTVCRGTAHNRMVNLGRASAGPAEAF
jgi:hypothetical protein